MNHEVNRNIMAIGAHADDIEVNVGATLLKYHEMGYAITYVMATNNMSGSVSEVQSDGSIKVFREGPVAMMGRRKRECDEAARVLGTVPIHLDHPQRHYHPGVEGACLELRYGCALPEGVPADVPSILTAADDAASVSRLSTLILEKSPECVLTHTALDPNIEHSAVCTLVTKAFWEAVENGFTGGLLYWNCGHSMYGEFSMRWDTFIQVDQYLDRKMELVGKHRCQMPTASAPDHGHRLLTEWRGKSCGCRAAEVFNWVRRPARCSKMLNGVFSPILGEISTELLHNTR